MFTNNFASYMTATFRPVSDCVVGDINVTGFHISLADNAIDYTFGTAMRTAKCEQFATRTTNKKDCSYGVWFGSGMGEEVYASFALESPITSGLSITNPEDVVTITDDCGNYIYSATYIVVNTTDADITLGEVGVFMPISHNSTTHFCVMMARTVFSEPIIIEANQSKTIEYRVQMNHIHN